MTISCRDADYIPKVADAGKTVRLPGRITAQRMHNGLLVKKGGYYGDWMARIVRSLKGHHEPQEEKAFYEVLKRVGSGGTMIELGAHWAYYSMWFNKSVKSASNYCFEPDPGYLEGGKLNASINGCDLKFFQAAAGRSRSPALDFQPETMPDETISVPIWSVDEIVSKNRIKKIDLLHMDIQGAELDALEGAKRTISKHRIRFVFVSTHHHSISNDPLTHQKCLEFFRQNGAHIVASHSIHESFSGDGLIVASFDRRDRNFRVELSHNTGGNSLFVETEVDLAELARAYSSLYDKVAGKKNIKSRLRKLFSA